ncbi:MAG: hypothetical protein ACI4NM_03430 [Bullifex sp.]
MVKKFIPLLFILLLPSMLFADFTGELKAGVTILGGKTGTDLSDIPAGVDASLFSPAYTSLVTTGYQYQSSSVRSDIRVALGFTKIKDTYSAHLSLERADFRFRIPSFGGRKMTVTAGFSPVSWGIGAFYRTGDVLLPGFTRNEEAGKSDSRNVWLVSATQSFGGGFAADAAITLPLPSSVTINETGTVMSTSQKLTFGTTLRKNISSGPVKSIHIYGSVNEDRKGMLAAAIDAYLWADITAGVETCFRSVNDFRATVNMMKMFTPDGETLSLTIGTYLAGEADFHDSEYELTAAVSLSDGMRLTLSLSAVNFFRTSGYIGTLTTLSASMLIIENCKLEAAFIQNHEPSADLYALSITLRAGF